MIRQFEEAKTKLQQLTYDQQQLELVKAENEILELSIEQEKSRLTLMEQRVTIIDHLNSFPVFGHQLYQNFNKLNFVAFRGKTTCKVTSKFSNKVDLLFIPLHKFQYLNVLS